MTTRTQQVLIVVAGLVAALVMGFLGIWQATRAAQVGDEAITARASQAAVPLVDWIHADGTVDDVYGKPVTASGRYLPDQQLGVVAADGSMRVLTALQLSDGRVVPVARGGVDAQAALPAPPTGEQGVRGIFLPGEGADERAVGTGQLSSVRMPLVVQRWPQQVVPGFVTLNAEDAAAQGLRPATVTLPHGDKSLQNGSYALQWWVFAAFALVFTLKLAATVGQRERAAREASALAAAATVDDESQPAKTGVHAGEQDD